MTTLEWERSLVKDIEDKGLDIPVRWKLVHDTDDDGCMPVGWYLIGINKNNHPIDYPIRMEFGPFDTTMEAESFVTEICQKNGWIEGNVEIVEDFP
jgi:hypothetical protein